MILNVPKKDEAELLVSRVIRIQEAGGENSAKFVIPTHKRFNYGIEETEDHWPAEAFCRRRH